MKEEVTKYRLILIITLLLICTVNIFLIAVSPEEIVVSNGPLFEKVTISKHHEYQEFNTNNSPLASTGLKVEIVAISSPFSFDSGDDHFSNIIHLNKIYSVKKYSLTFRSNLIMSKMLHISPLITRLQI